MKMKNIEHLDFDLSLSCEMKHDGELCGKDALWLIYCNGCGISALACEDERQVFLKYAERIPTTCRICKRFGYLADCMTVAPIPAFPKK